MKTGEKLLVVPMPDAAKRRLRIAAAERGVSMKQMVQSWVDSLDPADRTPMRIEGPYRERH